jgi:hypothetical protein
MGPVRDALMQRLHFEYDTNADRLFLFRVGHRYGGSNAVTGCTI